MIDHEQLHRDGYALLRGAIPAQWLDDLRAAFDAASSSGEAPVLLTSGGIRGHVHAIVERIRPGTPVLAQAEIFHRARIRTIGGI